MLKKSHPLLVGVLVIGSAYVLAGCGSSTPASIPSPRPTPVVASPLSIAIGSAVAQGTVRSEKDFILLITPVLQESIATAKVFVGATTDQNLKALAQGIINNQTAELATLHTGLEDWYHEKYPVTAQYQPRMRDLRGLTGDQLDRTFATDMAAQHQLGITLAGQVLALKPRREIQTIAGSIQILQMEEMLTLTDWVQKH